MLLSLSYLLQALSPLSIIIAKNSLLLIENSTGMPLLPYNTRIFCELTSGKLLINILHIEEKKINL